MSRRCLRIPTFRPPSMERARRVAGRRGDRGTIKDLDPVSSPPPIIPDIEFSPVRLKADVPGGQPSPSHSSPACTRAGHGLRWPSGAIDYRPLSRRGHSPANAGHSRRLSPSRSPRRPGALRSSGLLSPASLLLRPHVPVSRSPTNFPVSPVISSASTSARPSPL